MTRGLDQLLALDAVTEDGLVVTSGGTLIRQLELSNVEQPLTCGSEQRRIHRARLRTLASRIQPHQSLQLTVIGDHVPVDHILEHGEHDVHAAATARATEGKPELAIAMQRMYAAEAQTLRRHANPRAAQDLRYIITVPWRTSTPPTWRPSRPSGRVDRSTTGMPWQQWETAVRDSERATAGVASELAHMDPRLLNGSESLALLRHRLAPATAPNLQALAALCGPVHATGPERARKARHRLLAGLAGDIHQHYRHGDLQHPDGSLERILRLETSPEATTPWWLMGLLDAGLPWRLTVHIRGTVKKQERFQQRARYRRLRATRRSRTARGWDIGPEHEDAELEAQELDAELHRGARAALYDVSVYYSLIDPDGDKRRLDEITETVCREFSAEVDAELRTCGALMPQAFASSLPLGHNPLAASRRYASRNIADLMPLVGSRCGTPDGVPLGFALPGRTLELLDPFDPKFSTAVGTITGLSGEGKTLTCARLLKMWISRGATVRVIDRSSLEDPDGGRRAGGHYEPLAQLVPGAKVVHLAGLGTGSGAGQAVICPWDVDDPANLSSAKVKFLAVFHALLIGDSSAGTQRRTLSGIEQSLLERAIAGTYQHAADTGERPCEQLLLDTLAQLAGSAERDNNHEASRTYRLLAERLAPYGQGGVYAPIANEPTTVDGDAPMVVFDLAGVSDELAGPLTLAIIEREEREIARRCAQQIGGDSGTGGSWTGRTVMVLEEGWSQLSNDVAGSWVNEYARRIRHMAGCLIGISQHLTDFRGDQGRALLRQSAFTITHRLRVDELDEIAPVLRLSQDEIETIATLKTQRGEYSTCYLLSDHGRGPIRIQMAELEYWMCSANPRTDQPLRAEAQRQTGGDPWAALKLLGTGQLTAPVASAR